MNTEPLVSIIIPTFHCEPYIKMAIESAVGQTYKNIEIIIINNSGEKSDQVNEIINEFKSKSIQTILIPNNGAPDAKNKGIRKANGKYIYILGGDDILISNSIEKHVSVIELESIPTVTYSDYRHFLGFNEKELFNTPFLRNNYSGLILKQLIEEGNFIAGGSALMPKEEIIKAGMFQGYSLVDWDLWLRMSINGCRFKFIDEILLLVRKVQGSLSSDENRLARSRADILEKILNYNECDILKKKIMFKLGNANLMLAKYYYKGRDIINVLIHLKIAMRYYIKSGFKAAYFNLKSLKKYKKQIKERNA